jgi:hypothetical protein
MNNQQSPVNIQQSFLMHPDLQHLIQLQELDLAAERARRRIAELPAAQQALEARVADRSQALAGVKERIAAGQTARRDVVIRAGCPNTRASSWR